MPIDVQPFTVPKGAVHVRALKTFSTTNHSYQRDNFYQMTKKEAALFEKTGFVKVVAKPSRESERQHTARTVAANQAMIPHVNLGKDMSTMDPDSLKNSIHLKKITGNARRRF